MVYALLLSGGTGTRLGADIPKQYLKVNGKMIIEYSLDTLLENSMIDGVFIVAEEKWRADIEEAVQKSTRPNRFKGFAMPGETRQLSILNGLRAIKENAGDSASVLIHDAARPGVSDELIEKMIAAYEGHDGVMPVLPVKDTVYMADMTTGRIVSLLDRSRIVAGQAPELFSLGKYLEANEKLFESGVIRRINGSTELAYLAGMDVAVVDGDEDNFKITTMADLKRFTEMVGEK